MPYTSHGLRGFRFGALLALMCFRAPVAAVAAFFIARDFTPHEHRQW